MDSRLHGNERSAESYAYPNMQPWREVRTPERNYGPARLAGGGHVTPLARRLAAERGIDLSQLKGSGPHGRVVARDVETAAPARGGGIATGPSAAQIKALFQNVAHEVVPLDGMRATIARRLVEAKQTVPHFYLTTDLDIGRLMAMREDANAAAPKDASGNPAFKLSVNDFIIKAWAAALVRTPAANAVWAEDSILRFAHADIGVAVAIEGGLITPVVRHAEEKRLSQIASEMKDLAARARARKLAPHEYQGGTTSVSNLGMYGIKDFAAVINPPHATILAIGAGIETPVVRAGKVEVRTLMTVTLSVDHRAVDGALGAEFLRAFKNLIEKPAAMLA